MVWFERYQGAAATFRGWLSSLSFAFLTDSAYFG